MRAKKLTKCDYVPSELNDFVLRVLGEWVPCELCDCVQSKLSDRVPSELNNVVHKLGKFVVLKGTVSPNFF
jgi:hypothetical protein